MSSKRLGRGINALIDSKSNKTNSPGVSYINDKDMKYQIRNNKSYSFNESNILALEQEEEEITSDFINFALNEIKSLSLRLR